MLVQNVIVLVACKLSGGPPQTFLVFRRSTATACVATRLNAFGVPQVPFSPSGVVDVYGDTILLMHTSSEDVVNLCLVRVPCGSVVRTKLGVHIDHMVGWCKYAVCLGANADNADTVALASRTLGVPQGVLMVVKPTGVSKVVQFPEQPLALTRCRCGIAVLVVTRTTTYKIMCADGDVQECTPTPYIPCVT